MLKHLMYFSWQELFRGGFHTLRLQYLQDFYHQMNMGRLLYLQRELKLIGIFLVSFFPRQKFASNAL